MKSERKKIILINAEKILIRLTSDDGSNNKTLSKLDIKGKFLNLLEGMYPKPTINNVLVFGTLTRPFQSEV